MNEELNVNVGDEVLYTYYHIGHKTENIVKVKRITPTGRIRVDFTDIQFNKYGRSIGDIGAYSRCSIGKLTDKDKKRIEERNVVNRALSLLKETKLTYEQAKKIIEILEGAENDGK